MVCWQDRGYEWHHDLDCPEYEPESLVEGTGAMHVHYPPGSKFKCVSSGLAYGPSLKEAARLANQLAAQTNGVVSGPHFYVGGPNCKLWKKKTDAYSSP